MDDETRSLQMLKVSTKNHRMKVIREDGLYRHIRFQEPGTSIWHWDLVTWPGHLVITGDLQDYHFARISDMFEFFRGPVGRINASYWAEKLCGHAQSYESYSPEVFKRRVFEYFRDWCAYNDGPHQPLWRAICADVLDPDQICEESLARHLLNNFRFYYPTVASADPVSVAAGPSRDFVPERFSRRAPRRSDRFFEFTDCWEWRLQEYDYHFLLSLHAIVWGINRYDALRKKSPWATYDEWPSEEGSPGSERLHPRSGAWRGKRDG